MKDIQTDRKTSRTLADLADHCARETDRYFRGQPFDPQHCYELFRRAFLERDAPAWEAVFVQYEPLVRRWVQQHPGLPASGEEAAYFVNRAYEKIWSALTPEKFERFPELGGLLRYLKMCVHSVITDHNRGRQLAEVALEEAPAAETGGEENPVEERALEWAFRVKFWEAVQARLNDEQEQRLVYAAYVLDLKPREIQAQFTETFQDVEEVYRVKQNVLARLRRDSELESILAGRD